MTRRKTPLAIRYWQPVGQELAALAAEAEKLLVEKKVKIAPSPADAEAGEQTLRRALGRTAEALAGIALFPEMILDDEFGRAATRHFKRCFARYPDSTLQILTALRQIAAGRERQDRERQEKEKNAAKPSDLVRKFFRSTQYVVKKKGRFIRADQLTIGDYQPDRNTLRPGIDYIHINAPEVFDKDIAELVFGSSFTLKEVELVKKVRQSLSPKGRIQQGKTQRRSL